MSRFSTVLLLLLALARPGHATEIFSAKGSWAGKGLLPIGAEAPLQQGRCELNVAPDPGGNDVSVTGKCFIELAFVVSDVSIRILRSPGGKMTAGFWTAATGQTLQLAGAETDDEINLASATELVLDNKQYESHVRFSAPTPDSFTIRVLLRAKGTDAWRKFAEVALQRVDG